MKRAIIILTAVCFSVAMASALPYRYKPAPAGPPPAIDADSTHNWDALHYDLRLQVTPVSVPNNLNIDGEMIIHFMPEITGLDTVDLHLHGLNVTEVQLDGVNCNYSRDGDMMYVALPGPHNPGEELDLYIHYSGTPEITNLITPTGIFYSSSTMIYTMNDPFGARNWMPCWDEPWDKATVQLKLVVPTDFEVVANGDHLGTINMGAYRMWVYDMTEPITTYLISFCASDYETFEQTAGSVAIKHYVYPQHLAAAQYDFGRVPEAIEAYAGYFGPYPFSTYGYAEAPMFGGGGAMEHQTIVTFGNLLITGNRAYEDIVVHELGHMWFGDAVSYIDWPEMWLSEGFATYSEALWHQHLDSLAGYHQYMLSIQSTYYGWENPSNPLPIYDPPWNIIWSPLTYEKAASVLHMLRYHVGYVDFFDILHTYVSTYQYGNASTTDLMNVVEGVTGDDYGWFFNQWIYQAGYPNFDYFATWEPQGDDELITLMVAQTQNDIMPRFRTDADLYVFSGGDTTIVRVAIQPEYAQDIEVVVTATPDSVQLDPLNWILGFKYRRDDLVEPVLAAQDAIIDDAGGNGFLEPGEQGDLSFVLTNTGLPAPDMTVELTSHDPQLTVLEGARTVPPISFNGQFDLSADPFVVENADATGPRWVDFTVQVDEEASGDPVATLQIALPVGVPELLLVDDDDGGTAEENHQAALVAIRRVYQTVEYTSAGDLPDLNDYYGVIWACGTTTSNTLNADDITLLETYLTSDHGALMLTGRGIVPDLAGNDFFENVLHARDAGLTGTVVMVGVDPLLEGLTFFITGDGSNNDVLETDGGAGTADLLVYSGGSTASAIKYDGDYKCCVFGFGFEDVQTGSPIFAEPSELLGPLMAWFTGIPGVKDEPQSNKSLSFSISGCYPNPFNPTTVISFQLPVASLVKLDVFDVNGRNVGARLPRPYMTGQHQITFDGSGLSSGIYIYRLTAGNYTASGKILLLK